MPTFRLYAFTIEWKNGSFNDNIVKFLKANNIDFHYNHFFQLVADVLDWCKCAICWTDIYTIERLLHIEGGKIVGYENGEFYILKSDNHGNLYHIKARAEAESFIKMCEEA